MNLHKHQLYLLEQHSESFKSWSAIIRINTEGKSLIIKLSPGHKHFKVHFFLSFFLRDVTFNYQDVFFFYKSKAIASNKPLIDTHTLQGCI